MSDWKFYEVFDAKVNAYVKPVMARTHAEAIRMFEAAVNAEGSDFARWSEDYSLFYCGDWSEEDGLVKGTKAPEHVRNAWEFVKTEVNTEAPERRGNGDIAVVERNQNA